MERCHYEVLGVSQDATPDDIRRAYKKAALEWHPDKNPDRLSDATVQFQLIQQAYEVLIDPHERAWYDQHRTVILNGGLSNDFKEDIVIIQPYYSKTCFSGYGDDEKGFYHIYRKLFVDISREDYLFWPDDDDDFERPDFGDSTSSYEEVVDPFYTYWLNFETFKPYTWCNVYDPTIAQNRKMLKLITKENKKMQNYLKKKRNQEIRNFVAYIRKLDPRVAAHKEVLNQRAKEKAEKLQQHIKMQKEKKKKELEEYWEKYHHEFNKREDELKQVEEELDQMFKGEGSNDDDEEESEFFCYLCNKHFRSERAFTNHENSKKHKENLQFLQEELHNDQELLGTMEGLNLNGKDSDLEGEAIPEDGQEANKYEAESEKDDDKEPPPQSKKKKKKQRKQKVPITANSSSEEAAEPEEEPPFCPPEESPSQPDEKSKKSPPEQKPPKLKGKKAKEARKKAREAAASSSAQQEGPSNDLHCNTCHAEFPTRNKLFSHLKATNHARYVPPPSKSGRRS